MKKKYQDVSRADSEQSAASGVLLEVSPGKPIYKTLSRQNYHAQRCNAQVSRACARATRRQMSRPRQPRSRLRLGVTMKSVTLGNVTMSHRTRGPPNALRLSHSTMIGLPRAQLEN
ncbi:hypothetical protein EVAR_35577_1 [Eumeta japonica]|uniref:Uncharacterized protein n=1 Tax=Eumeta variegata TaxID=151549 RepID=A0A4C1XL65_EUMVA|nr:hypothetical protein EVAR_35577_1 [Eumeta japonica]